MESPQLQRTMSLTDVNTSSAIRDGIERDVTIPGDRSRHRFFLQLPRHDFILPSLTRFDQDFRKYLLSALVDFSLMQELEDAKCANWCSMLPKFLPLQTLGDGNCLMHAASLCMWAVQDRRLTLRKTVYQVLIEDQTEMFRKRWQFEQENHLEEQNGSPVDCSNEQWDEDWKKTIELASTTKSSKTHVLNALEEIHIFALANILRRPILVLCDDVHRGNYDESLADVNLGGIYLPLLCDSVDCVKSPIVIGYHQGHFMALVTTEDGSITGEDMFRQQRNKNAVPLVKSDDSPMQLHFLLPDEQQSYDRLLREYLNCSKLQYTNNDMTRTILVATMQSQEPEAHLDQMFKTYFAVLQDVYLEELAERQLSLSGHRPHPGASSGNPPYNLEYHAKETVLVSQNTPRCCSAHKKCKNAICENYTTNSNDYCHQCRKTKPQLCTSPSCTFAANPDYEGLCSRCFTRYRAILEQGASMVTPSAPPSNRCSNSNCQNEAGALFRGKCHACYVNYIQHANLGNIATIASSTPTGEQHTTAKPLQNMQVENNFGLIGPALPRQNSRLFCFNQMCNNPLQNSKTIYCETCSACLPQRNDEYVTSNFDQPGAINTNFEICRISGCSLPAVTYHGQLCNEHYKESLSHHQNNDHTPQRKQEGIKCINAGCKFFGVPDHNYLCSQCHAKALQEQYDMQRIKAEQDRAQAEWIAQMASSRAEQSQFDFHRKPFYYEAISKPNTSTSAPPSPNRRKSAMKTVPCVTKGCPRLGTEEKQGLCDICFKKKEMLFYQGVSRRDRHSSMP